MKIRTKALALLLSLCMQLPILSLLPVTAVEPSTDLTATDGVSFEDQQMYYADGKLADVPHTIEVMLYIPEGTDETVRAGTIVSTYTQLDTYYFHFDVNTTNTKLYPRFEFKNLYDTSTSDLLRNFNFKNATLEPGEWTHIAILIEPQKNQLSCYKNGEFVQSNSAAIRLGDMDARVIDYPLVIGNDNRFGQEYGFKGRIASLSMYSDVRTAEEISADYQNASYTDPDTLAHWEFTSADQGKNVMALAGPDLSYSKRWVTEAEMTHPTDYEYALVAMGDIQYIVENDVNNGTTYTAQMHKWIADNAESKKIKYVMSMGDITNADTDAEWAVAAQAIKQLDGVVDYSVIRGNHDVYNGGTGLDTYFGDEDYLAQFDGTNGGTYDGSLINTWRVMTLGSTDWLFVNLDFGATDAMVAWATDVIEAHPNHKVIITTHCYMHGDGTTCDDEDTGSTDEALHNNGHELWDELVSQHENIVMVLSGHQEFNLVTWTQGQGVHGNTVSQFLIDQQAVDKYYMNKSELPAGLVTMLYFDQDGKTVSVEQYSPLRDAYFHTVNQFSFDMTAEAEPQTSDWNGYSITPSGTGSAADPYIIENGGNLIWMSKQLASKDSTTPGLDGKYFKQVCDIDLNRCAIKSIGYYYSTKDGSTKMSAFGGHYDGGGYSIMNGRIVPYNYSPDTDICWGGGLFGVIYGATVKNIVLENVDVYSRSVTGGIVGIAAAPMNGNAASNFNQIIGCDVKSDCNIYSVFLKSVNEGIEYNNVYHSGIIGSVCGMAYATTIQGCTADVDVDVFNKHSVAGGIVGAAGYNTVVDHCAFTGSLTLTEDNSPVPYTFGGIVGLASPNGSTGKLWENDLFTGGLIIQNCYNLGTVAYTGGSDISTEVQIGGILGHAYYLFADQTYVIDNCHNMAQFAIPTAFTNVSVGGIVGKTMSAEGATREFAISNSTYTSAGNGVSGEATAAATAIDDMIETIRGRGFFIGDTAYEDLSSAIAAAESGDTIVMRGDFTVSAETAAITITKNITIDGRGNTLAFAKDTDGYFPLIIRANVTFTNFWMIQSGAGVVQHESGTLTLSKTTVEGKNAATVYVKTTSAANLVLDAATVCSNVNALTTKAVLVLSATTGKTIDVTLKNRSVIQRNHASTSNSRTNTANYVIYTVESDGYDGACTLNLKSGSRIIANNAQAYNNGVATNDRVIGFIRYRNLTLNAENGCYFILDATSAITDDFVAFSRKNKPSNINIPHCAVLVKDKNTSITYKTADGHHYLSDIPSGQVTLDGTTYVAYDFSHNISDSTKDTDFASLITNSLNDGTATAKAITLSYNFFAATGQTVPAGKTLVIDLGGKALYAAGNDYLFSDISGNLIIKNGTIEVAKGFNVKAGGSLTLENVTATVVANPNATVTDGCLVNLAEGAALTAKETTLKLQSAHDALIASANGTLSAQDVTLVLDSTAVTATVYFIKGTATLTDNGVTLSANKTALQAGISMPTMRRADATFVGYNGNGKLYAGGMTYQNAAANATETLNAIYLTAADYDLLKGASLRAQNGSGIRFETMVSDDLLAKFGDSNVLFGTLIAKNVLLDGAELNLSTKTDGENPVAVNIVHEKRRQEDGYVVLQAALLGIPDTAAAYQVVFAARGYMTVTYADGSTADFYTEFRSDEHVRSMYQVAKLLEANHYQYDVATKIIQKVEG